MDEHEKEEIEIERTEETVEATIESKQPSPKVTKNPQKPKTAMMELSRISRDLRRACYSIKTSRMPNGRFPERSEWAACMAIMMQTKAAALVGDPIIDGFYAPEWAITSRAPHIVWMENWLALCGFSTTFSADGPMGWGRKGETSKLTLSYPCGYRTSSNIKGILW